MKRIPVELIVVVLLIGVAIGIMYSRWTAIQFQIAQHETRLQVLETDHAKRIRIKTWTKPLFGVVAKGLTRITFGLVKFE